MHRLALVTTLLITSTALAQNPTPSPDQAPPTPAPPTVPTAPTTPTMPTAPTMPDPSTAMPPTEPPPEEDKAKEKKHKSGDFDAGGQLRFPKGPDEMGEYKAFNWVAFDAKGTYYLLPSVTLNGFFPFAVKKPDTVGPGGPEPKLLGGALFRLDASIPKMPKMPFIKQETSVGLQLGFAYMREGALLLSDKDFPLFVGDLQPGFLGGLLTRVKLSNVVDFNFNPVFLFQTGETENLTAVQIPLSLVLKAGDVLELGTEMGINTGDDFSFGPKKGGRISLGVSLDLKISKIAVHLGTGFASLLTSDEGSALYPTIKDSVYFDFNVKYVK